MVDNADEAIRRAMEEGGFDNLPGKGKPLDLNENPFEDPEWRAANNMLHSAGFSLPWIESRREIESELQIARSALSSAWARRQSSLAANRPWSLVQEEWQAALGAFEDRIKVINKQIFNYNLEVPLAQLQLLALNVKREIEKITGTPS